METVKPYSAVWIASTDVYFFSFSKVFKSLKSFTSYPVCSTFELFAGHFINPSWKFKPWGVGQHWHINTSHNWKTILPSITSNWHGCTENAVISCSVTLMSANKEEQDIWSLLLFSFWLLEGSRNFPLWLLMVSAYFRTKALLNLSFLFGKCLSWRNTYCGCQKHIKNAIFNV